MKKIVLLLLYLLLVPIASFAISLNELQNTPSKYIKVGTDQKWDVYVVNDSTQLLRENPPYYTIGCKGYFINYEYFLIQDFFMIVNYDYNRSARTIGETIGLRHKNDEKINREQIEKEAALEIMSAGFGMKSTTTLYGTYTFDGQLKIDGHEGYVVEKNKQIELGSAGYNVANYLFNKYYHERFC